MTAERQVTEKAVVSAEERYRLLVEAVSDYAIFMLDPEGVVLTWNRGGQAIKGYSPNEIIGRSFVCFYTPEDVAAGKPYKLLALAVANGHVEEEAWRLRKDGTRFWADVVITAVHNEAGTLVGFSKVTRDLTQRRNAEAQSRQFELLVRSVSDYAILMMDPNGRITTWNTGAELLKGYTEAEIIGEPYERFFTPEDVADGKPCAILRAAREHGHLEDEGWRVRKDGSRFWAMAVVTALYDEAHQFVGFGKVTRDLTERRLAEQQREAHAVALEAANVELTVQSEELLAQHEELTTHQVQLNEQNLRLHRQASELQQLDAMKDNFLAILSHELRTPLNAVLGFASILDDEVTGPMTGQQHDYLRKIMGGTEILLALINDLLDMSRIQAGKFTVSRERVSLSSVCESVVENLAPLAEKRQQTIQCDVAAGLPLIVGDRQRIFQVLVNLVNNAIKFSGETMPIVIRTRLVGERVRCEVIDHGIGIAAEDLPRLFQRFGQLEVVSNARSSKGTGLGLSISRALIEAQGGEIGVESKLGEGSIFWFELPLQKIDDTAV